MAKRVVFLSGISVTALLMSVIPSIGFAEIFRCHENGVTFFQESPCHSRKNLKADSFSENKLPKHTVKQKIKVAILEIAPLKKQLIDLEQTLTAPDDKEIWLSHEYGHALVDLDKKTIQILFDAYKLGLPNINGETGSLTLVYYQPVNSNNTSAWQCRAYGNSTRFAPTKCQIK